MTNVVLQCYENSADHTYFATETGFCGLILSVLAGFTKGFVKEMDWTLF